MENKKIIILSFAFSAVITLIGAFLKIMHWPFASVLLGIGLLFTLVFIVMSIIEINNSKKIDASEKLMWFVGFVLFAQLTGIVYILSARKRIINN